MSHRAFLENDETPMGQLPYLSRRGGGRYYFQMRMPQRCGWPALVRFSLLTCNLMEARNALCRTLAWMLPLRDAENDAKHAAAICAHLQAIKNAGHARTAEELDDRERFFYANLHFYGNCPGGFCARRS